MSERKQWKVLGQRVAIDQIHVPNDRIVQVVSGIIDYQDRIVLEDILPACKRFLVQGDCLVQLRFGVGLFGVVNQLSRFNGSRLLLRLRQCVPVGIVDLLAIAIGSEVPFGQVSHFFDERDRAKPYTRIGILDDFLKIWCHLDGQVLHQVLACLGSFFGIFIPHFA